MRNEVSCGRMQLENILSRNRSSEFRNLIINHKPMLRLFTTISLHKTIEYMNQRTFRMRKERDRLLYEMNSLNENYKNILLQQATCEKQIKSKKVMLKDELHCHQLEKKIKNSEIRLKATKTINGAYKKIIHLLTYDSMFYSAILNSLTEDMEDQRDFIKYVLQLGAPVIDKYDEMRKEFTKKDNKARHEVMGRLSRLVKEKLQENLRLSSIRTLKAASMAQGVTTNKKEANNYLKNHLEAIEETIKNVKHATVCSNAREIFPRVKKQIESNKKLLKIINKDVLSLETLEIKMKRASILKEMLTNSAKQFKYGAHSHHINNLKRAIKFEDEMESNMMRQIKSISDVYLVMRTSLWSLDHMLGCIDDQNHRITHPLSRYKTSYLFLPLLKFEAYSMRALPPKAYEDNLDTVMHIVKRKVKMLCDAYHTELSRSRMQNCVEYYQNLIVEDYQADMSLPEEQQSEEDEYNEIVLARLQQNVPSRKCIKKLSNKIVEENLRKDI